MAVIKVIIDKLIIISIMLNPGTFFLANFKNFFILNLLDLALLSLNFPP